MPDTPADLAEKFPDVWKAQAALGKATADCGPPAPRERCLVKLALAIGAGSEGAVPSNTRHNWNTRRTWPAVRRRREDLDRKHQEMTVKVAG